MKKHRKNRASTSQASFVILNMLAARPAAAYDLATRPSLELRYLWPLARSHVFAEVKRLHRLDWIRGTVQSTGRRRRTIFAVTAEGTSALAHWMRMPIEPPSFHNEALVRLLGARSSPPGDLANLLGATESELLRTAEAIAAAITSEMHATPAAADLHLRAVVYDYLAGQARFTQDWLMRTRKEMQLWPHDVADARGRRAARTLETALRALPKPPTRPGG